MEKNNKHRLVIVSNRLPITIKKEENGELSIVPGSGGLVTALAPILRDRGGLWIGWPGPLEVNEEASLKLFQKANQTAGFELHPVILSKEEIDLFYNGFANQIIWLLFHDLHSHCHFNPAFWHGSQEVIKKFAQEIKSKIQSDDFIWIHDYHLLTLAQELRNIDVKPPLSFFLHIPFPPLDIFLKLPWRFQVLRALLEYDLIGFQTTRDCRNFIDCVKTLLDDVEIKKIKNLHLFKVGNRDVRIGAFPISIDYHDFARRAASEEIKNEAWIVHEKYPDQKIVFSIDRLDLTKGIPYRLEAISHFLKHHPEFHQKVNFIQVLIPSRTDIPEYQELKKEVDRLVGEINSQFTQTNWIPILHLFRSLSSKELLAYYRTADVAFITPIKDGMNLVAKEYIASNIDSQGILIISEFAGAATQLYKNALLINPYDIEGTSQNIFAALTMPPAERKKRMKGLQRNVQQYDIFWWVQSFLNAAISKELHDFPVNPVVVVS